MAQVFKDSNGSGKVVGSNHRYFHLPYDSLRDEGFPTCDISKLRAFERAREFEV